MERLLQYIFDGLSFGAIYALVALGLVVVFRGTGHLNFAQGEMAMFCTFIIWQINAWGVPLILAVIIGMVFGFVLGAGTEATVIRAVAKKSPGGVFVVSIAMFLGLNSLATMIWDRAEGYTMGSLFPNQPLDFVRILGAEWRYKFIGVLVVGLVLMGLLFLLFSKTKFGLAMRSECATFFAFPSPSLLLPPLRLVTWLLLPPVSSLLIMQFALFLQTF
jgi:branched-chain amino acid transport system permease protein